MDMQELTDQHTKVLNIMRMGDIGLKIKKIIMSNQINWAEQEVSLNDN